MKPGARVASSIELLEQLDGVWGRGKRVAADGVLQKYFRARRFIGSKDRTEISRVVYGVLRRGSALGWWLDRSGREHGSRGLVLGGLVFLDGLDLAQIERLFDGEQYCPVALEDAESEWVRRHAGLELLHEEMPTAVRCEFPDWMGDALAETFGDELEAAMGGLNAEAPVDLRVNVLKATREDVLAELNGAGLTVEPTPLSEVGVRLGKRGPLQSTRAFKEGWVEVQDEGSQLAAQLVRAGGGELVIDFCAGAGGKTLALAAAMGNEGRILAWDVNRPRLSQLGARLKRAGVAMVLAHKLKSARDPFLQRHHDTADWVLVDAPCTGTGSWRRSPDLKWRTSPTDLAAAVERQRSILAAATPCVKPDGRLVYVTCSVLMDENERQVEWLLKEQPGFAVEPVAEGEKFLRLWPHRNGTDGFFGAVLRRAGV